MRTARALCSTAERSSCLILTEYTGRVEDRAIWRRGFKFDTESSRIAAAIASLVSGRKGPAEGGGTSYFSKVMLKSLCGQVFVILF